MTPATNTMPQGFDPAQFLGRVGNHELKTLTAAWYLSHPHERYNATQLRAEFLARQEARDGTPWVPMPKILRKYCDLCLVPHGIVTDLSTPATRAPAVPRYFQANAQGLEYNLAACGVILGFSLDFPTISVQMLGGTDSKGAFRSPELR